MRILLLFAAIESTYGCLKIVFRIIPDSKSVNDNEKAILLLNTRNEGTNNVPMVITMSGMLLLTQIRHF